MIGVLSTVVAGAGLVVAGLVLVSARSPATALAVLLDLLLAAGLLRLTADLGPTAIVSAALVVVVRKVAGLGIAAGRRRTAASPTS